MASQVLSGSSNPTYTNNTGQNVRLLLNYIANCTSMTWAGVTVTGSSTVGKDVLTINGEIRSATAPTNISGDMTILPSITQGRLTPSTTSALSTTPAEISVDSAIFNVFDGGGKTGGNPFGENIFYVPLSISPGGDFPSELILASGQAFSAQSGAFNIVVIKEDGT